MRRISIRTLHTQSHSVQSRVDREHEQQRLGMRMEGGGEWMGLSYSFYIRSYGMVRWYREVDSCHINLIWMKNVVLLAAILPPLSITPPTSLIWQSCGWSVRLFYVIQIRMKGYTVRFIISIRKRFILIKCIHLLHSSSSAPPFDPS